jgi:hypothetical protein
VTARAGAAPPLRRSRIGKTFVKGIAGPGAAAGEISALSVAVALSVGAEYERQNLWLRTRETPG